MTKRGILDSWWSSPQEPQPVEFGKWEEAAGSILKEVTSWILDVVIQGVGDTVRWSCATISSSSHALNFSDDLWETGSRICLIQED